MGFGGDYGVYHSAYDSFYWMTHFGDPTFAYHVTAAQLWGTLALRLADAPGLPLDYRDYAWQIRDYFNECMKTARQRKLAADLDEKSMMNAIKNFAEEAERVEKTKQDTVAEIDPSRIEARPQPRASARLRSINDALIAVERALTDERGLRGRTWYTHQIYAPGTYTGYAAQPLPDLRQALDDRNRANAKEALERIVEALTRATEALKKARD
jgi:N-acetylated-alpha-linked acidic dipeptidase